VEKNWEIHGLVLKPFQANSWSLSPSMRPLRNRKKKKGGHDDVIQKSKIRILKNVVACISNLNIQTSQAYKIMVKTG
jgi:hypothetical protein